MRTLVGSAKPANLQYTSFRSMLRGPIGLLWLTAVIVAGSILAVYFSFRHDWRANDAKLACEKGNSYLNRKDYKAAIAHFNEAIRLNANNSQAYCGRALSFAAAKDHVRAISDLTEAIRLEPKDTTFYYYFLYYRGISHLESRDFAKALVDFNAAIKLEKRFADAYSGRGQAQAGIKNYGEALSDYDTAIQYDSKSADAFNARAWIRATCPDAKYRDGKKAAEDAEFACILTMWKKPAYIATLAAALAEKGDFKGAINYQSQALDDLDYLREEGREARKRLALYTQNKPYHQE